MNGCMPQLHVNMHMREIPQNIPNEHIQAVQQQMVSPVGLYHQNSTPTEIEKYRQYIHEHALKYVDQAPDSFDPSYPAWYQKYQKVTEILHKKYMKKLAKKVQETADGNVQNGHDSNRMQNQHMPSQLPHPQIVDIPQPADIQSLPSIPQTVFVNDAIGVNGGGPSPLFKNQQITEQEQKYQEIVQENARQKVMIQQLKKEREENQKNLLELESFAAKQIADVNGMEEKIKEQEKIIGVLVNDHDSIEEKCKELSKVYDAHLNEQAEIKIRYNALLSKQNSKYDNFVDINVMNAENIGEWIIGLDVERYGRYYGVIVTNMQKEEIDGSCLCDLAKNDLQRWGINSFKDRRDILSEIKRFVLKKNESQQQKSK